jgi:hypothetical protein
MDNAFPPGGLLLDPISGNCKCFNLGILALLPMHFSILVTAISLWFGSPFLHRRHQVSERFDSKLAGVDNIFVTQQGRHISWPNVDPLPRRKIEIDRLSWLPSKGGHVDTLNRYQLALLDYSDRGFFCALSLSCKTNTRIQHAKTGHGLHCTHVRRLHFPLLV